MIRFLLVLALAAFVIPVAVGHTNGGLAGTPKPYCEDLAGDTNVHEYGYGGSSSLAYFAYAFVSGNLDDCDGDGVPVDFDGHSEFAFDGAYLLASDAGAPTSGATACFAEAPHHPITPTVWVADFTWTSGVLFLVGADTTSLPQPDPNDPTVMIDCGDTVDDVDTGYCIDYCIVDFAPGTDGSYHVYVIPDVSSEGQGDLQFHFSTFGHIYT